MKVLRYSDSDGNVWDELIGKAPMATFLHTRRYLSYHGDRFQDTSALIKDDKGELLGVFPAAVDPAQKSRVVSHPGITYGGLLHDGGLQGQLTLDAFEALTDHYRECGFETLRYKAVPGIYHQIPSADDIYALFRVGAVLYRCDLSCAIDLACRRPVSERRKRGRKKALKRGVAIADGASFIEPLWRVLEENLNRRFGVRPVHSADEIRQLHSLFPENIEFAVARMNSEVVGGVVLFKTPQVVHAQYTASSELGQEVCALDAVFEHCIEKAGNTEARYFNFGVSTEGDGRRLNAGLYQFKSEFGAGGVSHEFYELDLRK